MPVSSFSYHLAECGDNLAGIPGPEAQHAAAVGQRNVGERAEPEADLFKLWCCAGKDEVVLERTTISDSQQRPFKGGSYQVHNLLEISFVMVT